MMAADPSPGPHSISVVIPNYNGVDLFKRTLNPLFDALAESGCEYEVIVVDDCSTDSSVEFLRTHYPAISIISNLQNSGFSKTINRGIAAAKMELVFLLNSDIILTRHYFKDQLKYFRDGNTFGVMGRIIGWDDDIIQDAARYPDFHGLKIKTSRNYIFEDMEKRPVYTLYLSGANALIDRTKLMALRGFDELYSPFYIEDCDLSFRAWRLGWNCYYEHKSVCRHRTSTSIKAKNKKRYIELIYNRNKMFLHAIHLPARWIPFYIAQTLLEASLKALLFRPTLMQSFLLFIKYKRKWMKSRKTFHAIQQQHGVCYQLSDIAQRIRDSVKERKIIKFYAGELQNVTRRS